MSNYVIIKHIQTCTLTHESPLDKYAIHSLILFINSVTLTCAMMELDILSIDNRKEMNVSVGIFLYSLNKISTTYVCYLEAIPLASREVIFLKYELTDYRERTDDNF